MHTPHDWDNMTQSERNASEDSYYECLLEIQERWENSFLYKTGLFLKAIGCFIETMLIFILKSLPIIIVSAVAIGIIALAIKGVIIFVTILTL